MGILKLICIFLVCFPLFVQAQLSPGDLAEPHAQLEGLTNCTSCHELGEGPSAKKCLECHAVLNKQISEQKGMHYTYTQIEKKLCFSCHSDHAGKDFELIHWKKPIEQFDHKSTGYTLIGKHASLICRDCHNPGLISQELNSIEPDMDITKTYLGLSQGCLSCHHDEHRAQLGDDCLKCHSPEKWVKAEKFEHSKAKFNLTGKHLKVDCLKCHKVITETIPLIPKDDSYSKYVGLKFNNCTSCHQDIHVGKFGNDCNRCHVTDGWKIVDKEKMDHNNTKFPLTGKHIAVKCDGCHKPNQKFKKNQYDDCTDCHKDIHKGSFGQDCMRCHVTDGWKVLDERNADHSKTDFPLEGKHKAVKCDKCHKLSTRFEKNQYNECADCHSDYHQKQFVKRDDKGACESCHKVQGFMPAIFPVASHNKTEFKLAGAHLAQPCIVCHKMTDDKKPIRNFKPVERDCKECHRDNHYGQFDKSKNCKDCHSDNSWSQLVFDHNKNSSYKLLGAHKNVNCNSCHTEIINGTEKYRLYKPIDTKCESCHTTDVKPL